MEMEKNQTKTKQGDVESEINQDFLDSLPFSNKGKDSHKWGIRANIGSVVMVIAALCVLLGIDVDAAMTLFKLGAICYLFCSWKGLYCIGGLKVTLFIFVPLIPLLLIIISGAAAGFLGLVLGMFSGVFVIFLPVVVVILICCFIIAIILLAPVVFIDSIAEVYYESMDNREMDNYSPNGPHKNKNKKIKGIVRKTKKR